MKFETVVDITTKVMIASGVVGVGYIIYVSVKFQKEMAGSYENIRIKQEESRRMMKETEQHARRVFKAGEAQTSDLNDIINGETPLGL